MFAPVSQTSGTDSRYAEKIDLSKVPFAACSFPAAPFRSIRFLLDAFSLSTLLEKVLDFCGKQGNYCGTGGSYGTPIPHIHCADGTPRPLQPCRVRAIARQRAGGGALANPLQDAAEARAARRDSRLSCGSAVEVSCVGFERMVQPQPQRFTLMPPQKINLQIHYLPAVTWPYACISHP